MNGNSNLSKKQTTLLLVGLVVLAVQIFVAFFQMIYTISKNAINKLIAIFWFIIFLTSTLFFILLIFVFKFALNSTPYPIYLSNENDSEDNRSEIERAIAFMKEESILPKNAYSYVAGRPYLVMTTEFAKENQLEVESFPTSIFPFAYFDEKGTIVSLQGKPILFL